MQSSDYTRTSLTHYHSTTYISTNHTYNSYCVFETCSYLFVSSEIMKCRLLKRALDHPMDHRTLPSCFDRCSSSAIPRDTQRTICRCMFVSLSLYLYLSLSINIISLSIYIYTYTYVSLSIYKVSRRAQ